VVAGCWLRSQPRPATPGPKVLILMSGVRLQPLALATRAWPALHFGTTKNAPSVAKASESTEPANPTHPPGTPLPSPGLGSILKCATSDDPGVHPDDARQPLGSRNEGIADRGISLCGRTLEA
jgi:hypothetical protein